MKIGQTKPQNGRYSSDDVLNTLHCADSVLDEDMINSLYDSVFDGAQSYPGSSKPEMATRDSGDNNRFTALPESPPTNADILKYLAIIGVKPSAIDARPPVRSIRLRNSKNCGHLYLTMFLIIELNFRIALTKYRVSAHDLVRATGRYKNNSPE